MASIDEAYLDLTGTARLLGPPCRRTGPSRRVQRDTGLNCSIGIGHQPADGEGRFGRREAERHALDPAGPGGGFLAPLPVRKIPASAARTEERLANMGFTGSAISPE